MKLIILIIAFMVGIASASYWLTPIAISGNYRMTYQEGPSKGCYHEMNISIGGDVTGTSVCPLNAPALKWSGTVTRRGNNLVLQVGPAVSTFKIEGEELKDSDGPFIRLKS